MPNFDFTVLPNSATINSNPVSVDELAKEWGAGTGADSTYHDVSANGAQRTVYVDAVPRPATTYPQHEGIVAVYLYARFKRVGSWIDDNDLKHYPMVAPYVHASAKPTIPAGAGELWHTPEQIVGLEVGDGVFVNAPCGYYVDPNDTIRSVAWDITAFQAWDNAKLESCRFGLWASGTQVYGVPNSFRGFYGDPGGYPGAKLRFSQLVLRVTAVSPTVVPPEEFYFVSD